jgi:hypothetical protein
MPNLTIDGDEIVIPDRLIVRMAARQYRLAAVRRAAYLENARRRLSEGGRSRNDAALIIATGGDTAT